MAFRIVKSKRIYDGVYNHVDYVEAACNSEDTKEEGNFAQGSLCFESDTGKVFAFDEEASAGNKWVEQLSFKEE